MYIIFSYEHYTVYIYSIFSYEHYTVYIYSIFSYGHSTVYIYSYVYNTVGYVKVYADSVLMVAEVWVKLVVFVKYRAKMDK